MRTVIRIRVARGLCRAGSRPGHGSMSWRAPLRAASPLSREVIDTSPTSAIWELGGLTENWNAAETSPVGKGSPAFSRSFAIASLSIPVSAPGWATAKRHWLRAR